MEFTDKKDLPRRLAKFSNLPSVPQIILKIKQVADDPKATAADLANCILSDHQLTSRILRMANSVHYGEFSGKITTVTHAIVLMGFRAVHNIAVSMAVYEIVNKMARGSKFDATGFWTRSLACGIISKFFAYKLKLTTLQETAFIAGFMHDIGQPIMASVFPEKYAPICQMNGSDKEMIEAERAVIGIDHMGVGEIIAEQWNLPPGLVKPIAEHHRLNRKIDEKSPQILTDLVYLSDQLYPFVMGGNSSSDAYHAVVEQAKLLTGVDDDVLVELLGDCRTQVTEIAQDLEIDIQGEIEKCAEHEGDISVLHQQLNNKEVQLAFLQNATTALMEAKSNEEIQQVICEAVFRGLQMGRVILFEYNRKWDTYSGQVGFGVESQQQVKSLSFSSRTGLFKNLHTSGNPISIVSHDSEVYSDLVAPGEFDDLQVDAFAVIPLKVLDEVRYAIFVDATCRTNAIDDETMRSIVSLANQGAMSLERNIFKSRSIGG